MAANKMSVAKFAYGDVLQILTNSPQEFKKRGEKGSVCGIDVIHSEEQQKRYSQPFGTVIYLLEFCDGTSLEVPELHVEGVVI